MSTKGSGKALLRFEGDSAVGQFLADGHGERLADTGEVAISFRRVVEAVLHEGRNALGPAMFWTQQLARPTLEPPDGKSAHMIIARQLERLRLAGDVLHGALLRSRNVFDGVGEEELRCLAANADLALDSGRRLVIDGVPISDPARLREIRDAAMRLQAAVVAAKALVA